MIDEPNNVGMKAADGGDVRWILPGLRELEPAIFGTPDAPFGNELLPLDKRAVTGDNTYVAGMGGAPMPTPSHALDDVVHRVLGAGDLWVNGVQQPDKRFVHFMLSNDVRDDDYNLPFDDGVDPDGPWQAHLILPAMAVGADGPFPSPVPTDFVLPNGATQPFLHIMFEDVRAGG